MGESNTKAAFSTGRSHSITLHPFQFYNTDGLHSCWIRVLLVIVIMNCIYRTFEYCFHWLCWQQPFFHTHHELPTFYSSSTNLVFINPITPGSPFTISLSHLQPQLAYEQNPIKTHPHPPLTSSSLLSSPNMDSLPALPPCVSHPPLLVTNVLILWTHPNAHLTFFKTLDNPSLYP